LSIARESRRSGRAPPVSDRASAAERKGGICREKIPTILAAIVAAIASSAALALSYPVKPVKLIVPFPPRGNTGTLGRLMARKLTDAFGCQFFVENRGERNRRVNLSGIATPPVENDWQLAIYRAATQYRAQAGGAPSQVCSSSRVLILEKASGSSSKPTSTTFDVAHHAEVPISVSVTGSPAPRSSWRTA